MMHKTVRHTTILLLLLILAPGTASSRPGGPGTGSDGRLSRTVGTPAKTRANINNISTLITNDGNMDVVENAWTAAFVYPAATGKTPIFASALVWAGQVGDSALRAGGCMFQPGLQPGKILPSGAPDDPNLPAVRIYRVRAAIAPGTTDADISAEVRDAEGSEQEIFSRYWQDWNEWPWQDGAPYDDRNGDHRYNPAEDVPGVPGADQTLWYVANDLSSARTVNLFGSMPIGIELQVTVWGYARSGALGNVQFRRYLMINRSGARIDSMYVSQWVDPDLGDASDDLVGCDTTRSLGFVYNSKEYDAYYGSTPPPSVGFDFFQGPVVPGLPTDEAIFMGKRIRGKRNLPMTAFYYFVRGDPTFDDPYYGRGLYVATVQLYNYLRGLVGNSGQMFRDPNGVATPFTLAGDPLTRQGWVDGVILPPGDRRFGPASGPFTMMPGDTQEVVVGVVAAGAEQGIDRLSAISLMKFYDDQAQQAYDNFFQIPGPPPPPRVQVRELDQSILLRWDEDTSAVGATERSSILGYAFEGYNVYQLPSASASLGEGRKLATFDLSNGVTKVWDRVFDPGTGSLILKPVQLGTDGGIQRYAAIDNDVFTGRPLLNSSPYYFAVTAYNVNPDPLAVPSTFETPLSVITAVPQSPPPGSRFGGMPGDTVKQTQQHLYGSPPRDGVVGAVVIDPKYLTGNTYRVSFDTVRGSLFWGVLNESTGDTLVANQKEMSGVPLAELIDGMRISVANSPSGMRDWSIPSGKRRFGWTNANWGMEGFEGAMGLAYSGWLGPVSVRPYSARTVLLVLAATDTGGVFNPADTTASFGYRYLRLATSPPARPEFSPYILNPSAGYAYQAFERNIPLAAYDMDSSPPRRLAVGFLENNVAGGLLNGRYWPGDETRYNNTATGGPREWLFVFDVPYSETPNPALQVNVLTTTTPMMWLSTANRVAGSVFAPGDQFQIRAYHPFGPGNRFILSPGETFTGDQALARQDVSAVQVFPNPYYGANPQETNKYYRFVTFTHLPRRAVVRLFNLAGVMLRRLDKDDDSQFLKWDLQNDSGYPVGSGLYIAHIEMPDLGVTKILKLAIVQEQQVMDQL